MAKKKENGDKTVKNPAKTAEKQRNSKEKTDKTMKIVIISVAAVAAVCITLILLTAFGVIRLPALSAEPIPIGMEQEGDPSAATAPQPYDYDQPAYLDPEGLSDDEIRDELNKLLEPVDADAYFSEIGTVENKIPAYSAENVTTEAQTIKMMEERGFADYVIQTNYDMNGEYSFDKEIGESSARHPVYRLSYLDSQDRQWLIFITNGVVHASLVTYSVEHPEAPIVIVSETDALMGYDSTSNTFYAYKPNTDTADWRRVPKLTAEALDRFSI